MSPGREGGVRVIEGERVWEALAAGIGERG